MSEYQYYEFRAIDQKLTNQQKSELREFIAENANKPSLMKRLKQRGLLA